MSNDRDRTGERLGPYHLDMRYQDLDEPGGQVYAAHHVETGRPALVLVPESRDLWMPRSDWSARVTSQSSPPFLATELDRSPPPDADALTDMDLAFIRLAGGISSVEEREDANVAFTQPPPPGWRREAGLPVWRQVGRGALGMGSLLLGAVVLWTCLLGSPWRAQSIDDTSHAGPATWIDQNPLTPVMGYPMPQTPYPGQLKPPCGTGGYVEVRGGCWVLTRQDAPCPKDFAEYEGKCYVPVREKKPEPNSLKH